MEVLIKGRRECYVKKSPEYNPYARSVLYDWEFRLEMDDLTFENGHFRYETFFQGDIHSLLQVENFYYENLLVAQQITAGRLRYPKE